MLDCLLGVDSRWDQSKIQGTLVLDCLLSAGPGQEWWFIYHIQITLMPDCFLGAHSRQDPSYDSRHTNV